MVFTYGKGLFRQGNIVVDGDITLSEHKLFLKGAEGDYTSTYVPLEKIERICLKGDVLDVQVRLTISSQYVASFKGERNKVVELVKDIVSYRGFKKKFLKNEWVEVNQ